MHGESMHGESMHGESIHQESMPQDDHMQGHAMVYNDAGMVMNHNTDNLASNCEAISRDYEFVIKAGVDYALNFPGNVFGMDQHQIAVEPCSRIHIIFINEDQVRHQWMIHGLPKYIYDKGMFTLEAEGGQTQSGTFIVPGDDRTYLVHCDLPQHMEKGMKGQLIVGSGRGNLWSIPGVSSEFRRYAYLPNNMAVIFLFSGVMGLLLSLLFIDKVKWFKK